MADDYSGYLQKVGGKFGQANQTRYMRLYGCMLYYWKQSPHDVTQPPCARIDLTDAQIYNSTKAKHSWTVKGPRMDRTYTFLATSEAEKAAWVDHMLHINHDHTVMLDIADLSEEEEEMIVYTDGDRRKISSSDFTITTVIGRGSFGKVYAVVKNDTGERYAMKEIKKDIIEQENLTQHIFSEKSILQKINHPFIVKLRYAFQTKSRLFLVLDLLAGGELFFHLGGVGTFTEYRAKFYTAQIALALGCLHSLDIIYRDLKPENIVLDIKGHVCLTDFGLAKMNVIEANARTFCGTPEYLAPEFLQGNPHGKAVDWWSLGILLYEMLQGIPPFYSENLNEMYEQILGGELCFLEEPAISDDAKNLLFRLLDRNAETRLQNVEELKGHPFFSDIDFDLLYQRKLAPPFVPDQRLENNFDNEFTQQAPEIDVDDDDEEDHSVEGNFTYNADYPSPITNSSSSPINSHGFSSSAHSPML